MMFRHKFPEGGNSPFLLSVFCPEGTVKQYGYTQREKKREERKDGNIGNRWKYFYESARARKEEKHGQNQKCYSRQEKKPQMFSLRSD